MTDTKPSSEEVEPPSAAAFDQLYKSGAELDVALEYWDANVRSLIEAALDRVELINTPEESGLREHTAAKLKAELLLLPAQGTPLIPGYAKVNLALRVWLQIVQARIAETMQVIVDMDAEQIYDRFFGVLIDALAEEHQDPDQTEAEKRAKLDAALATAKETLAILSAPVATYTAFMHGAAGAVSEIADTLHEAAAFLVAQLNLLGEFLNQTDPQPEQSEPTASRGRIGKTLFKLGIKEGAIETGKEVAAEVGKEFLKEVAKPITFGLSILLSTGLSMRERKKALAEMRQELEKQAEILRAEPRPENYMHALRVDLQRGDKLIIQLIAEIDDFTNQLHAALAE
jgi:hypothetical protein